MITLRFRLLVFSKLFKLSKLDLCFFRLVLMSEGKGKMFDQHLITLFTQGNFFGHKAWVNSREGAPIVDKKNS